MAQELVIYRKKKREFLDRPENQMCAVFPHLRATQIHHKRGRGRYLNDTSTWLGVSHEGHVFIEMHPETAYENNWSELRNAKYDDDFEYEVEDIEYEEVLPLLLSDPFEKFED